MRKFRYIEQGHGKDSLTEHEIRELYVDFDISADRFYAIIPVTKAEFDLLIVLGWKPDTEKIPDNTDDPIVKTGTVRICSVCNQIVVRDPYSPNYSICGCEDISQLQLHHLTPQVWKPARVEIRMKKEDKQ